MNIISLGRSVLFTTFAASAVFLGACSGETTSPNRAVSTPTPAASPAASPIASPAGSPVASPSPAADAKTTVTKADALAGKWEGVEGTYLDVVKKGDKFSVDIKDLDKVSTFEGTAKDGVIVFTRNGKTETIKTATGAETGMKYLEKEKNCVVITKGSEGYCKK